MPDEEGKLVTVPDKPIMKTVAPAVPSHDEDVEIIGKYDITTLELSDEQRQILESPIPLEDLDIKPTGEVFASQVHYRRKLNRVFGPGQWALIEQSKPIIRDNTVIQKFALIAKRVWISSSWGEQDYFPNNSRQTYATALESAKSNALMRCCKDLGIASECWDKHYCDSFQKQHCLQVRVRSNRTNQGWEYQWRLKAASPLRYEMGEEQPKEQPKAATPPTPPPPPAAAPARRGRPPQTPSPSPPQPSLAAATAKLTPEASTQLIAKVAEAEVDPKIICNQYKVNNLENLDAEQYKVVMTTLDNILARKRVTKS